MELYCSLLKSCLLKGLSSGNSANLSEGDNEEAQGKTMAQGREHNSWSKELWIDLIWFLGSVSFNFALLLPVNSCNNIKE